MTAVIEKLDALEILDSRGRPTIEASCVLAGGVAASASVPSGASTGSAEAHELRDGDLARYRGLGCRTAVQNIRGEICAAFQGRAFESQHELDQALINLDGTPDKSRLGANAILAVSVAFARAYALQQTVPLYAYFSSLLGVRPLALPRPMINLFSGGKHAGAQVAIQDVQVMPLRTTSIDDTLAMMHEVFHSAAELVYRRFGMRLLTADEGGLAPSFSNSEAMLEATVAAVEGAGLAAGVDVGLTVDVAATHFYHNGLYHLGDRPLNSGGMIEQLLAWTAAYPVVSLEDGLAEEDWEHWPQLCALAQDKTMILGDDLLCTNPARIQQAIERRAANALLLKVNQIGTLSEAAGACHLARAAGWRVVVSARSGETEDHWLSDLAVGWRGDYVKIGSITQSERLAKYNRLLAIERETGLALRL